MELIIQLLMLLICLSAALKLSHAPVWVSWLYALGLSLFLYFNTDFAAEQTRASISAYIQVPSLREYIAILVTLETMLFVLFAFVSFRSPQQSQNRAIKRLVKRILTYYPSLLVFPSLVYVQCKLFFAFPGVNFNLLSSLLAIGLGLLFISLPQLFRLLLPEREMRLEVLFLSALLIFLLGLITTVNERLIYTAPSYEIPWYSLGLTSLIFLACFAVGIISSKVKRFIKE